MIYISLTTVPLRMNFWDSFGQNIHSLLNQKTSYEYKVILNIPYFYRIKNNEEYVLPNQLIELANNNPKLIINRIENDYGPVVKLVGALKYTNNPDDILIICDDDHYYDEEMVEYHIKKRQEYPNEVISFRGDVPVDKRYWIEDGVTKYTLDPTHFYFPVKCDSELLIPGHWHSVGYLRRFFDNDFFDENFLKLSNNDDILVGYYMKKRQTIIKCVSWDKETDYRPVNSYGRAAHSFPIKYSLPYHESGFTEFRKIYNDGYGWTNNEVNKLIHDHTTIYIEKELPIIKPVNVTKKQEKVIVTLTTLPTRITQTHETGFISNLNSLLNQDYDGEYEIHLNVPSVLKHTGEPYIIPDWLRELSRINPKLKIFEGLEDLGPITKSAHTIRRITDPEAIIIVCDDDLVYHHSMVAEQVKNQQTFINCSVGYDGLRAEDPSCFDDVRNYFVSSIYKNVQVNFLQHYKTVSYRRRFFDEDFFTDFLGQSWNDDILIGAYMTKQGIQKWVTFYKNEPVLETIEQWREFGGVTTFPVLRHTSHDGLEGCNLYRMAQMDENADKFRKNGLLK